MSQHACKHLPLKSLLPPDSFYVPFEPRQPRSKTLLGRGRIASAQPRFERFDEHLGTRPSRSIGDPVQAAAELLGQEELMPNLLRLHAKSRCGRMSPIPTVIWGKHDCLSDAPAALCHEPTHMPISGP